MVRKATALLLGAILGIFLLNVPAQAFNEFTISCEGVESTGGGALRYQYTLQNTSGVTQTLERFYIGTHDLSPADYTNWTAPAGFSPTALVTTWASVPDHSVMYTTQTKTPHGVIPPTQSVASAGVISWSGSAVVPAGGTVTFGFDNPYMSWDAEWLCEHPISGNASVGFSDQPIAGPSGVFTRGWVHSPGDQLDLPVIDDADTLYVPPGKTHVLHGLHSYNHLVRIDQDGILYITDYNGSGATGTLILEAPLIQVYGTINADACGYNENQGPGGGGPDNSSGAGAGYGGRGGDSGHSGTGGPIYGEPGGTGIEMGSGGRNGPSGAGGDGGGAITLVGTTVEVTGTVTAAGQKGANYTWAAGGGSGGGILIRSEVLLLSGGLRATGGDGGAGDWGGGAGAGGRIKLWGDDVTLSGSLSVAGGKGGNGTFGGGGGGGGTIRVFYCSYEPTGAAFDVSGGAGGTAQLPGRGRRGRLPGRPDHRGPEHHLHRRRGQRSGPVGPALLGPLLLRPGDVQPPGGALCGLAEDRRTAGPGPQRAPEDGLEGPGSTRGLSSGDLGLRGRGSGPG